MNVDIYVRTILICEESGHDFLRETQFWITFLAYNLQAVGLDDLTTD